MNSKILTAYEPISDKLRYTTIKGYVTGNLPASTHSKNYEK